MTIVVVLSAAAIAGRAYATVDPNASLAEVKAGWRRWWRKNNTSPANGERLSEYARRQAMSAFVEAYADATKGKEKQNE
jgi:CelD/BcsL family acetyltransferase involved in cellulose biosynthesis